ncbi:phosphatidate cytidylyltransferase [Lysobacter sp. D1-1-M9]|uniref:phosphatidate cytidylyltransferase n=1 Tax=Novilysobacter longmucuonensis TaxID=3098603 RepID=UPI002FC65DF2
MTRTRTLAALVMAPLAIAGILFLPTQWVVALAALLFLAGLWEWFALAEIDDALARMVLLVANLALMVAIVWGSRSSTGFTLVLLQLASMIGVIWWLLALLWLRFPRFARDHATHARAFKLAAGTLSVIPAWCALAWLHAEVPHAELANGHYWLLAALVVVWAADTGAYFAGRRFGKRKLAPAISPNKTVEGLLGGLAAAVVAGVLLGLVAGAELAQLAAVAVVALVAGLFSVVGDLLESLLKRHAGVKDSGHLIPGHGGILDRIDGLLAALPAFALGKAVLGF